MASETLTLQKPARTDELVPSRYALRVGDIDVLVISDGILPLPPETLAANAKPAELAAWLDYGRLPKDVFEWALNVVVVRSGGQTVLIDTGIGQEYPDFKAGLLAQRLDAAGVALESVTDIVVTHMHFDHIGGLFADRMRTRLPRGVPIHMAAAEAGFWEAPDFSRASMPPPVQAKVDAVAARFLREYRGQLRLFQEEREVAPGVVVRRTGGHTPGHSVVQVASGGERLTFLGDAVFPDHFDRPDWHNAFDHDPEEAVRVRVQLLRELAESGDRVVATHLSFPALGRVAVAGEAFRWAPVPWEY